MKEIGLAAIPPPRARKIRMEKPAPVDAPLLDHLRNRWSPRAFDPAPIPRETLRSLFEAARWAPSSNNAQPWRYILSETEDARARASTVLTGRNTLWAPKAPVLVCVAAHTLFEDGKPNRHAWYDTGQATSLLIVQATSMGLFVHQMAGFDAVKARAVFALPENVEPIAMMALGRPGDAGSLPDPLRERESAPRSRRAQDQFVFSGAWGAPW
jgi:nitroreductase